VSGTNARLNLALFHAQSRQITLEGSARRSGNRHLVGVRRLAHARANCMTTVDFNGLLLLLSQDHGVESVTRDARAFNGG
jgi:hypothetical protein